MNNYSTFITNFVQNFGTFYISNKYYNFFDEKSNRIVSWNYIGRIKLPEKFIEKYHKKMKIIVLYDYSEDFIKNKLFNYDIKIENNDTFNYSILNKYSEDFIIFLLNNTGRFNLSSNKIMRNYPFNFNTFNKFSLLYDEKYNTYNTHYYSHEKKRKYLNISNFNDGDLKILIKKFKKQNEKNHFEYVRLKELIDSFLKHKKITKKLRMNLINYHQFRFYSYLLKYQYLTPEEIKLIKKILIENKNQREVNDILENYFPE